jgi:hypothetical protein
MKPAIKRRNALLAKYGEDYFRKLGSKGGLKTKSTHSADYYKDIRKRRDCENTSGKDTRTTE